MLSTVRTLEFEVIHVVGLSYRMANGTAVTRAVVASLTMPRSLAGQKLFDKLWMKPDKNDAGVTGLAFDLMELALSARRLETML